MGVYCVWSVSVFLGCNILLCDELEWLLKREVGVYYEVPVHLYLDKYESILELQFRSSGHYRQCSTSVVVVCTGAMLAEVNICLLLDLH